MCSLFLSCFAFFLSITKCSCSFTNEWKQKTQLNSTTNKKNKIKNKIRKMLDLNKKRYRIKIKSFMKFYAFPSTREWNNIQTNSEERDYQKENLFRLRKNYSLLYTHTLVSIKKITKQKSKLGTICNSLTPPKRDILLFFTFNLSHNKLFL
jgi:hypothetical protein